MADGDFRQRFNRSVLLHDRMCALCTQDKVVAFLQDVVLRSAEAFTLCKYQAVVGEWVGRGGRSVCKLACNTLVDDAQLYAVEPSLFSEHGVHGR